MPRASSVSAWAIAYGYGARHQEQHHGGYQSEQAADEQFHDG
jgi:hypothetical protein